MTGPISPLELERYELKYLIPRELIAPISRFVEIYCELDYYSQIAPDQLYTINSLYLDSPSLFLLRSRETANAFSFNMRVRSYGRNPRPPYFFEIKYKLRDFCRKKRAKIATENWAEIVDHGRFEGPMPDNLQEFLFMAMTYNVGPVILTQYQRKAYISQQDDYARVTFDLGLRYQEQLTWSVKPKEERLVHYDHPDSFEEPGKNVILELKCEKKIPCWFIDLIRRFELVGGGFSKFGNSMATLHGTWSPFVPGPLYR